MTYTMLDADGRIVDDAAFNENGRLKDGRSVKLPVAKSAPPISRKKPVFAPFDYYALNHPIVRLKLLPVPWPTLRCRLSADGLISR
jgi:hypothetical protein